MVTEEQKKCNLMKISVYVKMSVKICYDRIGNNFIPATLE